MIQFGISILLRERGKGNMFGSYLSLPTQMCRQVIFHLVCCQVIDPPLGGVSRALQQRNRKVDLCRGEKPLVFLFLAVGAPRLIESVAEGVDQSDLVGMRGVRANFAFKFAFDVAQEEMNGVRLAVQGVATCTQQEPPILVPI